MLQSKASLIAAGFARRWGLAGLDLVSWVIVNKIQPISVGVCWWVKSLPDSSESMLALKEVGANAHKDRKEVLVHFNSVLMSEIQRSNCRV